MEFFKIFFSIAKDTNCEKECHRTEYVRLNIWYLKKQKSDLITTMSVQFGVPLQPIYGSCRRNWRRSPTELNYYRMSQLHLLLAPREHSNGTEDFRSLSGCRKWLLFKPSDVQAFTTVRPTTVSGSSNDAKYFSGVSFQN